MREEAADAAIVAISILAQTCDDEAMFDAELQRLLSEKCTKWEAVLSRQA
ncbi:hypothetical protein [Roseibium litorale]|nr:hypothetical protein [Roseibium litorale]